MSKRATIILFSLSLFIAGSIKVSSQSTTTMTIVDKQATELLHQLTLEEKIGLLGHQAKAIPRLGIPAHNWWNEALHGVARAGKATVFPQAIALAATFDESLVETIGDAISTEARAKYELAFKNNSSIQYMGLTFWSPNINIFRDPRWGRGQETYGEDPYLTAQIGKAFVRGLQGTDPSKLKVAAAAKHFAVHSGPENSRHFFDAQVDEKELRETYLYAFKELADAGVEAFMCAYNRVNGEPCCASFTLLDSILRKEWKFKGHVVADCWALDDIYKGHKMVAGPSEAAAAAIKAGVNLDCSDLLQNAAPVALQKGLLTSLDIDKAVLPLLKTMLKLGIVKGPVLTSKQKVSQVNTAAHRALAKKAAIKSFVLLKNDLQILPLQKNNYRSIMVIGPRASSAAALLGTYHGVSDNLVTPLEGIVGAAGPETLVQFEQGCVDEDSLLFGGIWAASLCDISIAVIGLNPLLEGEEHDAFLSTASGDKTSLSLPASHIELLKRLKKNGKPVVAVVTAGSAIDVSSIEPYADAILLTWYSGEAGGNALADVLFGKADPGGRLPVTFYHSVNDLPAFSDYSMKGRTYRYYDGPVAFPFGYGLSYTSFEYRLAKVPENVYTISDTLVFTLTLKNTGSCNGDELVQVYAKYPAVERMPNRELKYFKRISLSAGQTAQVECRLPLTSFQKWNSLTHRWQLYPGDYSVVAGSNSLDERITISFKIHF
jgi:beta-glucosidase